MLRTKRNTALKAKIIRKEFELNKKKNETFDKEGEEIKKFILIKNCVKFS